MRDRQERDDGHICSQRAWPQGHLLEPVGLEQLELTRLLSVLNARSALHSANIRQQYAVAAATVAY